MRSVENISQKPKNGRKLCESLKKKSGAIGAGFRWLVLSYGHRTGCSTSLLSGLLAVLWRLKWTILLAVFLEICLAPWRPSFPKAGLALSLAAGSVWFVLVLECSWMNLSLVSEQAFEEALSVEPRYQVSIRLSRRPAAHPVPSGWNETTRTCPGVFLACYGCSVSGPVPGLWDGVSSSPSVASVARPSLCTRDAVRLPLSISPRVWIQVLWSLWVTCIDFNRFCGRP